MKKIVVFLLLAFLLAGCQTNTFTCKHFPERVTRIHTIGLLPQVHTAILNTYFGKDPSPVPLPEEQQIRSELIASTIDQLQQRGFVVKEGSVPDGTNQMWNGLMIQQACSTLPSKAARPDAKEIADDMNVNGLIFLYGTAYKSTPHRQKITTTQNIIAFITLPVIPAGPPLPMEPWQEAGVQIALVDGETGDVIWTTADTFDDFEKNQPSKAVENLFNRYPKPKP
ncbi:MAG TPA: lipoprotein [Verrucomicrobiae bacterium]|nr:lipoprotein [Verrucomicrobiae bacterium]